MNVPIEVGDVPIDGQGLDQELVHAILERRVRAAVEQRVHRKPGLAVIVCTIGGERFAVPLAAIAEVILAAKPTPVPGAPESLTGLIVRRGLVYNLIDPAASLGVSSGKSRHTLLLRGPVPRIALRVDEATGTGEIAGAAPDAAALTETRIDAAGGRVELIAVPRLVATLGSREKVDLT